MGHSFDMLTFDFLLKPPQPITGLFLSLSSVPEFCWIPPPIAIPAVADPVPFYLYIQCLYYVLFISKRVWGHYGELISVKIQ